MTCLDVNVAGLGPLVVEDLVLLAVVVEELTDNQIIKKENQRDIEIGVSFSYLKFRINRNKSTNSQSNNSSRYLHLYFNSNHFINRIDFNIFKLE